MRHHTLGIALALALALTTACSADKGIHALSQPSASAPSDTEVAPVVIAVDVHPAESEDATSLLPQRFELPTLVSDATLRVHAPIRLTGSVVAYVTNPWRGAAPPGDALTIEGAEVRVSSSEAVLERTAVTDEDGAFAVDVVPASVAEVSVTHPDPLIAPWVGTLDLTSSSALPIDLGQGVSLWGHVTDLEGAPMVGGAVFALTEDGLTSGVATTDASGFYLLRVPVGAWRVVTAGRDDGRDPVLTSDLIEVGPRGVAHDVTYATLEQLPVGGRVVDAQGDGLSDVTILLHATALDGFDATAALDVEVQTDDNGNWDTRLATGTYDITYAPDVADYATSLYREGVRVEGDLGEEVLASAIEVTGTVVDPEGRPLEGAAIEVIEAISGRTWSLYSGDRGVIAFAGPAGLVEVVVTPTSERSDLALTRTLRDLSTDTTMTVTAVAGDRMSAHVVDDDDNPLAFAWIELRDDDDRLWGATLTDDEGWFDVVVSPGLTEE